MIGARHADFGCFRPFCKRARGPAAGRETGAAAAPPEVGKQLKNKQKAAFLC
jgi:hypothetical protein